MHVLVFVIFFRFVFAHNCYQSGVMTDTEWHMYCDWHSFLTESLPVRLDGFIYLRTNPKVYTIHWNILLYMYVYKQVQEFNLLSLGCIVSELLVRPVSDEVQSNHLFIYST